MTYNFRELIASIISPCKTVFLPRQVGGEKSITRRAERYGSSWKVFISCSVTGKRHFYSITFLTCCLANKCTLFDFMALEHYSLWFQMNPTRCSIVRGDKCLFSTKVGKCEIKNGSKEQKQLLFVEHNTWFSVKMRWNLVSTQRRMIFVLFWSVLFGWM